MTRSRPRRPAASGPATAGGAARLAAAVLLAGVLGACGSPSSQGSAAGGSTASADPSGSASASPSPSASPCPDVAVGSREQVRLDVDGDGRAETVGTGRACGATALVATRGDRTWSVPLAGDEPPVGEVFGVRVPGRAAELVVTRATHPRGGYQLRVYAADAGRLVELRRGTEPLVPFVATDVQEHPLSIDCGRSSLVVTEAVAHEPVGVVAAWDVRRTAYALDGAGGATLTPGRTREVADNVLPGKLGKDWADLVDHAAFPSCRVP